MSATHHFIAVLSLLRLNKKEKEIQRNTLEIFLEFLVFRKAKQTKRKRKSKNEKKLFTRESSQQAKEEQGNLFGFSLN